MAYFFRPSWHSGSSFASRTRPPGATSYGSGRWVSGRVEFVRSLPLVMHDACADSAGVGGHPRDDGREAFSRLAGGDLAAVIGGPGVGFLMADRAAARGEERES